MGEEEGSDLAVGEIGEGGGIGEGREGGVGRGEEGEALVGVVGLCLEGLDDLIGV